MRLAPVPLFYASRPAQAIFLSGESSRTTHQATAAIDSCRYFGALIIGALNGAAKTEILSSQYSPVSGFWKQHPLCDEVAELAQGSFKHKDPPEIQSSTYVIKTLEAALWAFHTSDSFEEGCLKAVNLGNDADTTGSIYGQLAGAFYGKGEIPTKWLKKLVRREGIENVADRLYYFASKVK